MTTYSVFRTSMADRVDIAIFTNAGSEQHLANLKKAAGLAASSDCRHVFASFPGYSTELAGDNLQAVLEHVTQHAPQRSELLRAATDLAPIGKTELRVIDESGPTPRNPTQWSQSFIDAAAALGWDSWTAATTEHMDESRGTNEHMRAVVAIENVVALLLLVLDESGQQHVRRFVLNEGDILFFLANGGRHVQHAAAVHKRGTFAIIDLERVGGSERAAPAARDGPLSGIPVLVRGERFIVSPAALSRLGPSCMLNLLIEDASDLDSGVTLVWTEPLTVEGFALVMEWAATAGPFRTGLTPVQYTEMFRAADYLNVPEVASLGLARGPPPSQADRENYTALLMEEPYWIDIEATTFMARREAVDRKLPLGGMPHLFERARDRAGAPLFNTPGVLHTQLNELLPPEARICIAQGLCLAGGFAARIAASLAGLCEVQPSQSSTTSNGSRPDIDFFLTTGNDEDPKAGLYVLRKTLIALARHCEDNQIGVCFVRSPYAITVAMDDCDYDLQIVLNAFCSMDDVLSNFDIDACRIAYDGERMVASETFIRAIVSGTIIARPQYESHNYAKRLHKYATLQAGGFTLAIADFDPMTPGKTPTVLRELERVWHTAPSAGPIADPSHGGEAVIAPGDQWEVAFTAQNIEQANTMVQGRPFATIPSTATFNAGPNPALYASPEVEQGPAWDGVHQPQYVAPLPQLPRLFQLQQRAGVAYNNTDARAVVEVWRGQRRHPRGLEWRGDLAVGDAIPYNRNDYWRYDQSSRLAFQLSSGFIPRKLNQHIYALEEFEGMGETVAKHYVAKDVVFQTLDMHPVRGAWNSKQKAFLATAVETEPLKFLDYIEDAALVVPKACRDKLTRCLVVPIQGSSASAHFRPRDGVATWPDA